MKICFNCQKEFQTVVTIEGIKKNLQQRRYCLECSPFGKHLTRRLPNDLRPYKNKIREVASGQEVICTLCSRFYVYDKRKGHRTNICNSCSANQKRAQIKEKAIEYKGGSCINCGYSKCKRALSFHHKNPDEKEFIIGRMFSYSWNKIKKELDKCDLLCANCHMELHDSLHLSSKDRTAA